MPRYQSLASAACALAQDVGQAVQDAKTQLGLSHPDLLDVLLEGRKCNGVVALELATGDPSLLTDHGVYAWPFALDSIGWSMQSYQDYGGTPSPRQLRGDAMSTDLPEIMTIGEAAQYLRISSSSLYKLAQTRRVPCQKVGRHWRFRKEALDRWLEAIPVNDNPPMLSVTASSEI